MEYLNNQFTNQPKFDTHPIDNYCVEPPKDWHEIDTSMSCVNPKNWTPEDRCRRGLSPNPITSEKTSFDLMMEHKTPSLDPPPIDLENKIDFPPKSLSPDYSNNLGVEPNPSKVDSCSNLKINSASPHELDPFASIKPEPLISIEPEGKPIEPSKSYKALNDQDLLTGFGDKNEDNYSFRQEGHHSDCSGEGPANLTLDRILHETTHQVNASACQEIGIKKTKSFAGDPFIQKLGNKYWDK